MEGADPGLLPANCPSSFSSDIPNITYEIEGLISTGPFKFDPFIVTEVISATPSPSVCFDDRTTVGCRLCVSGDVAYTVELPRTSFTVGEEIPVNWYVENGSGRRVTLLCVLREEMVFLASGSQRSARNILSSQSDLTVPPHRASEVVVCVPVPPCRPAITCSNIIKSSFWLDLTVGIPRDNDSGFTIPVTIGNASLLQS